MQIELFDVEAFQVANDGYMAMVNANKSIEFLARGVAFDKYFACWF